MRKCLAVIIVITVIALIIIKATDVFAQSANEILLFYGTGCPHCARVEKYFIENNILIKYPVEEKEIYSNKENALLFNQTMDRLGISMENRGVPAIVIGNKALIGDKPILDNFITEADIYIREAGFKQCC